MARAWLMISASGNARIACARSRSIAAKPAAKSAAERTGTYWTASPSRPAAACVSRSSLRSPGCTGFARTATRAS